MLDGQGKVRLTDFGLAGLAEALSGDDVRSGTPSYMSPEQLQGREVTVRSDIYALGLLIYELVTGRRAFEGKGLAELARKHRDERPIDPSAIVPDLDPAVERTILACLEKDPKRRPPSALVVSAMLSGRDPLEAAIAAGETPSPELVAAAGETEGLRPRAAWACLLVVVLGALLAARDAGPPPAPRADPGREEPRGARGPGPRSPGPPRPGRPGRRQRGGLLPGRGVPALGPGAGPLRGPLGLASAPEIPRSCPSGTGRARAPSRRPRCPASWPGTTRRCGSRAWRAPRTTSRGGCSRSTWCPPSASARAGLSRRPTGRRSSPRRGSTCRSSARSSPGGRRPSTPTRARRGRAPGRAGPRSPCASRPPPTAAAPSGSRP